MSDWVRFYKGIKINSKGSSTIYLQKENGKISDYAGAIRWTLKVM